MSLEWHSEKENLKSCVLRVVTFVKQDAQPRKFGTQTSPPPPSSALVVSRFVPLWMTEVEISGEKDTVDFFVAEVNEISILHMISTDTLKE